jgi:putative ABC transport system substrate-binding protein
MKRMSRVSVALLLFGALAPLLAFGAQHRTGVPKIGYLCPYGSQTDGFVPFRDGLAELGYVIGKTISVEASACMLSGSRDDFRRIAAEMVRSGVDVIVAPGRSGIEAARSATTTRKIPLVFLGVDDPVTTGLVASLARPGGHITGLSSMTSELGGKRLELLKELIPNLSRAGVLVNPATTASAPGLLREAEATARALKIQLHRVDARAESDLDRAFATLAQVRPGAVLLVPDPMFFEFRTKIVALAASHRLPLMAQERAFVDVGGLSAYGPSLANQNRQVAQYVNKILKGAKPADLPVEQPTKFELVINLKTAKTLGLTIPPSLLARADQVIE